MNASDVFDELVAAAIAGRRCPQNFPLAQRLLVSKVRVVSAIKRLTVAGQIKIEIAGHNWRVVTILTGPCAGKQTASAPNGATIYRRLDAEGDHWLTRQRTA